MAYEYDPYLTKSSARGMYILSVAMLIGSVYLAKLSAYAWRTDTMVHLGGGGRSVLWPWEGFVSAFLMFAVGIFAWWAARRKAKEWRGRERQE